MIVEMRGKIQEFWKNQDTLELNDVNDVKRFILVFETFLIV